MKWQFRLAAFVCAALTLLASSAEAQQAGRVTGTVIDSATSAPVAGATIALVATRHTTTSRSDGTFILSAPFGTYTVRATRLGFAPREMQVTIREGVDATVTLGLRTTAMSLDAQVVVGYGSQRRAEVTGAVSSITPNATEVPTRSLEQMLVGTVPGVSVTQASGEPGGGISIRIRGGSSITGNNEPLYVIDGFPIENDIEGSSAGNAGRDRTVPFNPLNSINPEDIESVDILKDASATAIYGARGANGVVIITTKRGGGTRPRFTLDSYTGTQSVAKRLNMLNGSEFAQFVNEWGSTQTPVATPYTQVQIDSIGAGTDWQDAIFRNGAPIRNLQIGISGGSAGLNPTKYSLSGGVFDQEGVVRTSEFRRVSIRGGLDQTIGTRFRASSNLALSRVSTTAIPTSGGTNQSAGAIGAALQYFPTLPIRRTDGTYSLLAEDAPVVLAPSTVPNPVSLVDDVTDRLGDTRVLANLFGEYTFAEGLVLRVSGGTDYSSRFRDTYYPRTTLNGRGVEGEARRGRNDILGLLNENTLSYHRSFGSKGTVNSVVGYTRQQQKGNSSNMLNTNFVSDLTSFEDFGSGARPNGPTISTDASDWTFVSYLGRVNYSFRDRYITTLTARRDGSSRFGAGKKWGVFPSVGVAWALTEESFMPEIPGVASIKLRASWGIAGNPSIRPYQSLTQLGAQRYAFGGVAQTGYFPTVLGNSDLTWETTEERDFGADLEFWKGRVSFSGDIYNKHTRDLLIAKTLPLDAGFGTVLINTGSVRNVGEEFAVTAVLFDNPQSPSAFHWSTSVNYASNRNRVLDLGGDTLIFAARAAEDLVINGSVIKVGQPLGVFYGYQTAGILRDAAAATAYTAAVAPPTGTAWAAGDMAIADINGDGRIDIGDRTVIGSPLPDYTIGWTNTVSFRDFDLTSTLDGSYGATLYNLNLNRLESGSPRTNLLRDRWTDRWTPTTPDAKYPRIGGSLLNIGQDMTSDMLEDGTYTRLRNVTLGYRVPTHIAARAGLSAARLYVTGANLFTWTEYGGFNPDVSSISVGNLNRGIDIGAYPLSRSFTLGFNLSY